MSKEFLLNNEHEDFKEEKNEDSFKVTSKNDDLGFFSVWYWKEENEYCINFRDKEDDRTLMLTREQLKYLQHTINRYFQECE